MSQDIVRENTIHALVARQARRYGQREFLRFGETSFSFIDLEQKSRQTAAGLQSLGVAKGDKVAILMGNRPEYLFFWFGLSMLGAIEVPINIAHRGKLLSYMLDQADCTTAVVDAILLDRLVSALPDLPKLERVVIVDQPEQMPAELPGQAFYNKIADNDGEFNQPEVIWSDPFGIMFTSGTTGPSKGALMPQNYALYMGEMVSEMGGYGEDDCLYNALPLFHGNAQFLSTMPALMSGARMVLAPRFSASQFWNEVREYGCTEFNYIGSILPILLKADPKPDDADNPLRLMIGAGCPPDLFDVVEKRFGLVLVEGYGMSELGLPVVNSVQKRKKGTIGQAAPGYQVRVVDDDDVEVEDGVTGELIVRPQKPFTMMLEYYRMPQATMESWRDLWFRTGDYVVRSADGSYMFVDRKKDALRRGGENISSFEVEAIINSHPAVMECAAVAAKSELAEDEVMVCVVRKPDQELAVEELMDYCQENMAYFMVPRFVRFMDALPKTPTLRVQKVELRKQGITDDTWDRVKAGYEVKR
jgi:crotonobetaine/carnitine-CoA ligase